MRVFISGAYSAPSPMQIMYNVTNAMDAAVALIAKGHHPFVPHLYHYVGARSDSPIEYETWMTIDRSFLDVCDALLLLSRSPGADRELERAKELGMKIFYSLEEINEAI